MMLFQAVPPLPPPDVAFDPNLLPAGPNWPAIVMIVVAVTLAVTIICWPLARALARRLEGKGSVDPTFRSEIDQMHHRLDDVDGLQTRIAELEDRLDFAERLLARGDSAPTVIPRETP